MVIKYYLIFSVILLTAFVIAAGCGAKYSKEARDALANCLAEKNVKEYGAFWCPNCAEQERKFGDSMSIIKSRGAYIECDPRCVPDDQGNIASACRGIPGQPELCLEKNIERYPTWDLEDGTRNVGVMDLKDLAEFAGCPFNA